MLDDTHNDHDIARHARMSLVRSGLIQRIRLLRKYSGTYVEQTVRAGAPLAVA
jgi:hypothetical protein